VPVIIDYAPVGSVADAASNIGAMDRSQQFNQDFLRSQQLQQQGRESDQNQQFRYAQLRQQGQEANQTNQYRYDDMAQRGQQAQDDLDFRREQAGASAPQNYTDPESGQQFQFTPKEQAEYGNLKTATQGDPDAFQKGLYRMTTGQNMPEETQEYSLQGPDGKVYTPSLTSKELVSAIGQGFKQMDAAAKTGIQQQNADTRTEAQKATDTARQQSHSDLITYQNRRMDLDAEELALRTKGASTKELTDLQARKAAADKAIEAGENQVAANEIKKAINYREDYIRQHDASNPIPPGDPELQRRQGLVQAAIQAGTAIAQKHLDAKIKAATQPAPSAQAAPVNYSRTATGPNGAKLGLNPNTNQWEPLR
jgi:hypothetical protein